MYNTTLDALDKMSHGKVAQEADIDFTSIRRWLVLVLKVIAMTVFNDDANAKTVPLMTVINCVI